MLYIEKKYVYCILVILFFSCSEQKNNTGVVFSLSKNVELIDNVPKIEKIEDMPAHINTVRGMVYVPSGNTYIGSDDGAAHERPRFWIKVKGFLMDVHPVTVNEFAIFVRATHYKTEAERFGDAGVFDEETKAWLLRKGANWQYPQGKSQPAAPIDHPVTQVSWNDATAYATWAGKRLPTEFEWEHAARNARNDQNAYPFGNEIIENSKYKANVWQGTFPESNGVLDGFRFTSPVGYFGTTPLGLTDMTGNVWEWCEDWKAGYKDIVAGLRPATMKEKAQRGGSFLCEPSWCHGYRVSGRSFSTPETALMHVGFRCVKDLE